MANLRDIKRRILSVKSTSKITRAMKMVAAAKLRRTNEMTFAARPYSRKIKTIIQGFIPMVRERMEHLKLIQSRSPRVIKLVVVTSDRGLCGAFNMSAIKKAMSLYKEHSENAEVSLDFVGRKGYDFFKNKSQYTQDHYFQDTWKGLFNADKANAIVQHYIHAFEEERVDRVIFIYSEFKTIISQQIVGEQLLPILDFEESADDISKENILAEPGKPEILDYLLGKHFKAQVYRILLESLSSEFGARMSAMDNATNNALEVIDALTLEYNKSRQAAITSELIEIVSGAEALNG